MTITTRRHLGALFVLVLGGWGFPRITHAQALPDRSTEIRTLVTTRYQSLLDGSDEKGRVVTGLVCDDLNLLDGGNWGMLIKNDRNPPTIPYDILVWKPSREHVDILSGTNPTWIPHDSIPAAWSWLACPTGQPAPAPAPIPPPVPSGTFPELLQRVNTIEQLVMEIQQQNLVHETAEAAERQAAATFREDVRSAWRNRFVFIGKYIIPAVTGLIAGWKVP